MKRVNSERLRAYLHEQVDYFIDGVEKDSFESFTIDVKPILEPIYIGNEAVIMGSVDITDPHLEWKPPLTGLEISIKVINAYV